MKNVSKTWLMVLLFQTIYENKIPIQSKHLGSPLVAEQTVYCSAYFFSALVLWESEKNNQLIIPRCISDVEKYRDIESLDFGELNSI